MEDKGILILETERLVLRKWNEGDIDALVDGLGNFNVAKNLTVPFPYTKKNAEDFLKICNSNENNFHFAITLKENGNVIGGTSIEIDSRTHGGIWINEKYIGKGYGTEAWVARAKFGFEKLGLSKLENGFFDFNDKSWNMQRKVGYKIVGDKTNFSLALKKEVNEKITVLMKEDFYDNLNKSHTKIYLIRHAKSVANDEGLFGGVTDYDLSKVGLKQAQDLAERFDGISIDEIYSSPLKRAVQTTTPLAMKLDKKIKLDKGLIEIDVGTWENIPRDLLRKKFPKENAYIDATEHYTGMQGQEETQDVAERMFKTILKIAKKNVRKAIVVTSHVVAIRAFLCKIQNIPFEKTKEAIGDIPNTGITTLTFDYKTREFNVVKIGENKPKK